MKISVVSPIYKGEKMLVELVSRVETAVKTITEDYEIILVNDCSPDDSWTKMKEICATDKKVKGINLSRNFGQHYAITAGLTASTGEWVVVMDCIQEAPTRFCKTQLWKRFVLYGQPTQMVAGDSSRATKLMSFPPC